MAMPILDLMTSEGDDVYYTEAWRLMIETHLTFLINHPLSVPITAELHQVYKYEGDLYGLLTVLNVPRGYHYIVMRMNNITSPVDFRIPDDYEQDFMVLLTPSTTTIDTLRNVFQTTYKKIS